MASMVAKAASAPYSPALTVLEKGSRNKRKFRADPPLVDPNKIMSSPQFECTSFEFSAEKFGTIPSHDFLNGCDMCGLNQDSSESLKLDLGLSCSVGSSDVGPSEPREEVETNDEFHDADWSDLTESQLEELVLSNLDTIFKGAIKRIMAFGYSEEIAIKAVLRSGICYGCKDIVSNIVENTLTFLRCGGQEIASYREYYYFEDLQQMEKYVLAELVCVLREVRPFFSTGDAMWCLLICDMNVSHACAMEFDPLSSLVGDGDENSSVSVQPRLQPEAKTSESNTKIPCKPNPSVACAHCSSEPPNVSPVTCGDSFQLEASALAGVHDFKPKPAFAPSGIIPEKDSSSSLFDTVDKTFTAVGTPNPPTGEEEFAGSRKVSGITKREYILRQKSLHLEKHYRTYGPKGVGRKLNGFSGLVLDNKLRSMADSAGMNIKNASLKINKTGVSVTQDNIHHSILTSNGFSSSSVVGSDNGNGPFPLPRTNIPSSSPQVNTSPALPAADTELSLSFPTKSNITPMPLSYNAEGAICALNMIPNEKSIAQWAPQDKKDEMILKLVPRVRELQGQLQEWTEWANQKVMQAARRLGKDKAELKTLRQEKEEVERLKKEKQSLEENTMKKLAEMENALCKASGQVERANAAVRRLEIENTALRREMEAAKLRAAESAASCQEVSKREKKTLMKFQSWEKQKAIFQDDLIAERRNVMELQRQLEQAKEVKNQLEGRWKQEEKANGDLFTQARSLRKERQQIENSAKSKEDMTKLKAESSLQKYRDDIERLEKEISQLRLKTDSSKIAALKRGIDGTYASKVTDFRNSPLPNDTRIPYISTLLTDFEEYSQDGGVKRERECVMCLSEEMSVVFLPCAHQVVCTTCNELHEKQGMKECPSCRSTIQQRICVRYAHT